MRGGEARARLLLSWAQPTILPSHRAPQKLIRGRMKRNGVGIQAETAIESGRVVDDRADKDSLEGWLDEANADLDNPKLAESPWYLLLNIRVQQRLARGMYLYAGVDNLLDYHQADEEGPMYFPADDNGNATPADVVHIWGPLRGRHIYGGLKVDF